MKISAFEKALMEVNTIVILKPDGQPIPAHFHVTEVGLKTKKFMDCGGTLRTQNKISIQLWVAEDFDHRLTPIKLTQILHAFREDIYAEDAEVEIEYQQQTIGLFEMEFDGRYFNLHHTHTACLAPDQCKPDHQKSKVKLSELGQKSACCPPQSGCC